MTDQEAKIDPLKKVPNFPEIYEKEWFSIAVASALITTVLAGFLLFWVFYGEFPSIVTERMSIAGAIVAFCGAVTTFCTVAWRGLITTRQANAAYDQIDEAIAQGRRVEQQLAMTERQLAMNEKQNEAVAEQNLASLLEKAASLVADAQAAKQAAGLALLAHIARASMGTFRRECLAIFVDFVKGKTISSYNSNEAVALRYIDNISKKYDMHAGCLITITRKNIHFESISSITYRDVEFKGRKWAGRKLAYFESCKIYSSEIDIGCEFDDGNELHNCTIIGLKAFLENREITLYGCDLSRCTYIDDKIFPTFVDCYYYDDAFPEESIIERYKTMLQIRQRPLCG